MKYFNKNDFKIGMRVVTANKEEWVVMPSVEGDLCLVKLGESGWNELSDYDDTLNIRYADGAPMKQYAIDKIYMSALSACILSDLNEKDDWGCNVFGLIWERTQPKKMTKLEIERELGYEVEII